MRKFSSKLAGQQSGFTLIELVIVIVIIGILAAVAIPNLANVSQDAKVGKQIATLGALKGAWGIAYARLKVAPSCSDIAGAMTDPTCSASGNAITCAAVTNKSTSTLASFTCGTSSSTSSIASPAELYCFAANDVDTGC